MSNAVRKQNDTIAEPQFAVSGIKGYKTTDSKKFHERNSSTDLPRPRVAPMFLQGWRLPLIFIFFVFAFASISVALMLLLARPQKGLTAEGSLRSPQQPRIVLVEKEPTIETVTVLVPKRDIRLGEKLSPEDFTLTVKPKLLVPQNFLSRFEQLNNTQSRSFLIKGSPVTAQMLNNPKNLNPVISSIENGYRAVSILVNATSAVEGWASAGAFVDVHWVTNSFGDYTVNLLAQNAKIISAERQVEPNAKNGSKSSAAPNTAVIPTTITLLVTDRDAQKISLASTGGELKLHLRGMEDANKAADSTVLTMNDLLGGSNPSNLPRGVIRVRDDKGVLKEFSLKGGEIVSRKIA
jgi:Flp pilus assembly protein CpaB